MGRAEAAHAAPLAERRVERLAEGQRAVLGRVVVVDPQVALAGQLEVEARVLRERVQRALGDPRFVAIGEIGLDFFIPELTTAPLRAKQEFFYSEQLKIAREFDLPVILHVRRSQDTLLKYLRRIHVRGGIAHAFNGSQQQAQAFIDLGFVLGFGGAMTFTRAL